MAVSSSFLNADDRYQAIFTSVVGEDDFHDLEGLSIAPVFFHRWISKRSDIRVAVVDREAFASEILSQEHPSSRIDRRDRFRSPGASLYAASADRSRSVH